VRLDMSTLGFGATNLARMHKLIHLPHGIILVTGPTGSGKTTTLYSALTEINTPDKNILTVEDPVEYQLKGISQMQVNAKIDLSFASGLRSYLRHDPDIIMVGEIRDKETAEIAIQASLTGHLVLSTLHTNDAAGAFTRIIDMGVEPFLVASTLAASLAQRLVRKLCPECRDPFTPNSEQMADIGLTEEALQESGGIIYRAKGCSQCLSTGYSGRLGIYELLIVTDEIQKLVIKESDANTIKRSAVANAMQTLREDGARKVIQGITTIEEVMRVTQDDN
jgi:general secretion pathway protein E